MPLHQPKPSVRNTPCFYATNKQSDTISPFRRVLPAPVLREQPVKRTGSETMPTPGVLIAMATEPRQTIKET